MPSQIQSLEARLKEIGFEIVAYENVLQVVGFTEKLNGELPAENSELVDFKKFLHLLQVVIELEEPQSLGNKFPFYGCSLKVYFEDWGLVELAKVIKLNIAAILDENGIFAGMNYHIPKSHEEVVVP